MSRLRIGETLTKQKINKYKFSKGPNKCDKFPSTVLGLLNISCILTLLQIPCAILVACAHGATLGNFLSHATIISSKADSQSTAADSFQKLSLPMGAAALI